jgi:hypothetical protein
MVQGFTVMFSSASHHHYAFRSSRNAKINIMMTDRDLPNTKQGLENNVWLD